MTLLSINGLFSRYSSSKGPVYAVDDVDFELDSGESLGIAGESACGKSTLGLSLMRMLSGGTSFGKILFDGDSIRFWQVFFAFSHYFNEFFQIFYLLWL